MGDIEHENPLHRNENSEKYPPIHKMRDISACCHSIVHYKKRNEVSCPNQSFLNLLLMSLIKIFQKVMAFAFVFSHDPNKNVKLTLTPPKSWPKSSTGKKTVIFKVSTAACKLQFIEWDIKTEQKTLVHCPEKSLILHGTSPKATSGHFKGDVDVCSTMFSLTNEPSVFSSSYSAIIGKHFQSKWGT